MTAREEVERLLAEHWFLDATPPRRCSCGLEYGNPNAYSATHAEHVAQVLDVAGLLADEGASSDTWDAAREAGYAEALIAVERYVKAQSAGMMLDGARFGLADVLDILAHLSADREARP